MSEKVDVLVQIAHEVADQLDTQGLEAVLVWGSISERDYTSSSRSDIDLLVIKSRLDLVPDPTTQILFGVPTRTVYHRDTKVDVFFVDLDYVKMGVEQGHWTVINAITNGIVIIDHGILDKLREMCSHYRAFALSTQKEWANQATNLLEKAHSLLDSGDFLASIILSRHAIDAMAHAIIYAKLGKPASPKSFLADLHNGLINRELYEVYLEAHGLRSSTEVEAMRVNLLALQFLQYATILVSTHGGGEL